MRYPNRVKPISYRKANAAEVLAQLVQNREPLVITRNGEAKTELQDMDSFFNPYRIICRIIEHRIVIHVIADGRRQMQSLLARRLSRSRWVFAVACGVGDGDDRRRRFDPGLRFT